MTKLRAMLVLLLIASAGYAGFFIYQEKMRDAEIAAQAAADAEKSAAIKALHEAQLKKAAERPRDDRPMQMAVPASYRRPVSDWVANEKAFYGKLLSGSQFDILVVPFQVQDFAIDRATRSLMAAQLAAVISRNAPATIPDPYIVAKALGDGQRRFSTDEVKAIASAIGAKRIIMGYVGHELNNRMTVSVVMLEGKLAGTPFNQRVEKDFGKIEFSEEHPPIEAYESLIPEIVKSLGWSADPVSAEKTSAQLDISTLPSSPKTLVDAGGSAARDAYTFLLYGLLTPNYAERIRERFAEKMYLAAGRMAPTSPEYRVLRARALHGLGYRIAAMKLLEDAQTDEEKEYVAVLNGNFPEVKAFAGKEKNPLKKLIQKLDENKIAEEYGLLESKESIDSVSSLKLPGKIWPFIAQRAFLDWDQWSQFQNAQLKMLLDLEFPVKGYALEEMVRGAAAVGGESKLQTMVDLSVLSHLRKYMESEKTKLCCQFGVGQAGTSDYLDLLQVIGHDNIVRRIKFLSGTQGNPEAAIAYANGVEAVYKGDSYYSLERAKAELNLAGRSGDVGKEGLVKSAYERAFDAMYWEQAQTHVSAEAYDLIVATGRQDNGRFNNMYSTDIPFRPFYTVWADGGHPVVIRKNSEAALRNAAFEFQPVQRLVEHYRNFPEDENLLDQLLADLGKRFIGSPMRTELLASEARRRGNTKVAMDLYRDVMRKIPDYWAAYDALGRMLFESGDAQAAANLFLSYPGFKKSSNANRVGISNGANEVGSIFYWAGYFELAQPFYKISAAQGTGANSELSSVLRLNLVAGDIRTAMEQSLIRAQRYEDAYAFRDYLGMMHASGQSSEAWAGFNVLIRRLAQPMVWESALVGHHMGGNSESEVIEWAKQAEYKGAGDRRSFPATHLLRFATTDRTPTKEISAVIDELDRPTWRVETKSGEYLVARPYGNGRFQLLLGPIVGRAQSVLPVGVFDKSKKTPVRSDMAYFSDGYRAIKLGDFGAAKAIFDEAATLYDFAAPDTEYALAYYALAAAKTGDVSGVEKILLRYKPDEQQFDYFLSKAAIAAVEGKANDAVQFLTIARHRRPNTVARPLLTQYTYGEVGELLAEMTHSPKIREITLDWARKCQKFEPWHSWSHAVEAKLSSAAGGRGRAIAMTQYLDPKSERLATIKKSEIEASVKSFSALNPFRAKADKSAKGEAI